MLRPGVSRLAGTRVDRRLIIRAAVLAAGEGAAASHFTAAELLGLDPVGHRSRVEVVVPLRRRPRVAGVTVHRSQFVGPGYVTHVDGIATTTVARTLVDLSGWVPDDVLRRAANDSVRRRDASTREVRRGALALLPQGGRGRRRALLDQKVVSDPDFDPGGSEPELDAIEVLRAVGLHPVQQFRVVIEDRTFFLDGAFPPEMVAVEYLGRDGHHPFDLDGDSDRQGLLTSHGWNIIPVTKATTPQQLVERVQRALRIARARLS